MKNRKNTVTDLFFFLNEFESNLACFIYDHDTQFIQKINQPLSDIRSK